MTSRHVTGHVTGHFTTVIGDVLLPRLPAASNANTGVTGVAAESKLKSINPSRIKFS